MTQKNRSTLLSDLATSFPDNSTGLITPAVLRGQQTDIIDSFQNIITDGQPFILVRQKSDLPTPSANVITLTVARYHIKGNIDLTGDTITMVGGSVISGDSATISSITTSSANPTITASNGGNAACGITGHAGIGIHNTGTGAAVRAQDSDTIMFTENLLTSAAGNALEINDVGGFACMSWTMLPGVTNGAVLTGDNPRTILNTFNTISIPGKGVDIQGTMSGPLLMNDPIITCAGIGIDCGTAINGMVITGGSISSSAADAFQFSGSTVGIISLTRIRLASVGGDAIDLTGASTVNTMVLDNSNLFANGGSSACFRTDADSGDNFALGAEFNTTSFIAVGGASILVNATKKDLKLDFSNCLGVSDSHAIGCYALTAPATTTINTVNVWERIGGTTAICPTLERFSQTANNTHQYDGSNDFSGIPHVTMTVDKTGASKDYEFSFGVDTGSGPVIDTSSIIRTEVKTTPLPISVVTSAEFSTGDDIGVFVRNIDDDDDIAVETMNVVIK